MPKLKQAATTESAQAPDPQAPDPQAITDPKPAAKRGRKAGGHNTKQLPLETNTMAEKFEDPPQDVNYRCWNCKKARSYEYRYCPECGSENKWA